MKVVAGIVGLLVSTGAFAGSSILTTDKNVVCMKGYSSYVRAVSPATKREVFRRSGLTQGKGMCIHGCVVDHRISLELGGSNDISNLQVQSTLDGIDKDRVENYLHRQVCIGKLGLIKAQHMILHWRSVKVK